MTLDENTHWQSRALLEFIFSQVVKNGFSYNDLSGLWNAKRGRDWAVSRLDGQSAVGLSIQMSFHVSVFLSVSPFIGPYVTPSACSSMHPCVQPVHQTDVRPSV